MKKKLSQAIAVATLVGAAGAANADMFVNGNGLGDVLLYPLYTADAGNDTYISVTNTTDKIKAVKVRMLEHKNSKEVLDFNLYLSPYDMWSAAITLDASGNPVIKTYDTSCTVGRVTTQGIAFRNSEYSADSDKSLARAKIGHIELIEMGNVEPSLDLATIGGRTWTAGEAIIHGADNKPGNCDAVSAAFRAGGVWAGANQNVGVELTPDGESGLYGTGTIVNVEAGWQASYDAVALANTYDDARHNKPGSVKPNFDDLKPEIVTFDGSPYEMTDDNNVGAGYNAVSALLSKAAIYNDYIYGAGLNAQTDMVVTFPTRQAYIDNGYVIPGDANSGLNPAVAPFTQPWNPAKSEACEKVTITYWDHEENEYAPADDDFSPAPETPGFALCYETNILHVGSNSNLFGGDKGHTTLSLENGFEKGWLSFNFLGNDHDLDSEYGSAIFEGMPVIGFATSAIVNGNVLDGVLSNYASTYVHKATPAVVR